MSRSTRKTPMYPNASAPSERADKQTWHGRWRARERTALASASIEALRDPEGGYQPVPVRAVSDPWGMAKDGRSYWSGKDQATAAAEIAARKAVTLEERASMRERLLHRWAAK